MKFLLYCQSCDTEFKFEHPAVNSLAKLQAIRLDCPNCKADLRVDKEQVLRVSMITQRKHFIRELQKQGVAVHPTEQKIGVIQLGS